MDKISKHILYEVAIRLNSSDIKNFSLVCRKYANIFRDEYFWTKKRLYEYPSLCYSKECSFLEKTKYFNIIESGYLYYIDHQTLKKYMMGDKLELVKKFHRFSHSLGSGLIILTYDGLLYMNNVDIYQDTYIGNNYICLAKNVFDFYYDNEVNIQDEQGRLQKITKNGYVDILTPYSFITKKYDTCYETQYVLAKNGNFYIIRSGKIIEHISDVNDFELNTILYYLKNNGELWCDPKHGIYESVKEPSLLYKKLKIFPYNLV